METANTAPAAVTETIAPVIVSTPAEIPAAMNVSEAARIMRTARKTPETPAAAPVEAAAPPELAEQPTSAPETDPAEPTNEADPAPEPSVEPPRSWPKEKKEAFKLLPPDLQREVSELERSREVEVRRGQNEVAEKLKAFTAKEQQAEQVRLQYEAALPKLWQTLQATQAGEFGDIKSQEDVKALAENDWPRFARYQAHKMQVDALEQETRAAQDRQATEYRTKYQEFASKEDAKVLDTLPELADKTKQAKVADAVLSMIEKGGISREDFGKAWNGEAHLPIRHAAMQEVFAKAALYDIAKATAAKAPPKPVPPVQKPGVAPAKGAQVQAQIQQAAENLSAARGNKSAEAAAKLYALQKAARR